MTARHMLCFIAIYGMVRCATHGNADSTHASDVAKLAINKAPGDNTRQ